MYNCTYVQGDYAWTSTYGNESKTKYIRPTICNIASCKPQFAINNFWWDFNWIFYAEPEEHWTSQLWTLCLTKWDAVYKHIYVRFLW